MFNALIFQPAHTLKSNLPLIRAVYALYPLCIRPVSARLDPVCASKHSTPPDRSRSAPPFGNAVTRIECSVPSPPQASAMPRCCPCPGPGQIFRTSPQIKHFGTRCTRRARVTPRPTVSTVSHNWLQGPDCVSCVYHRHRAIVSILSLMCLDAVSTDTGSPPPRAPLAPTPRSTPRTPPPSTPVTIASQSCFFARRLARLTQE